MVTIVTNTFHDTQSIIWDKLKIQTIQKPNATKKKRTTKNCQHKT